MEKVKLTSSILAVAEVSYEFYVGKVCASELWQFIKQCAGDLEGFVLQLLP